MDEPEWMTVLRIFWEENLGFEYSPHSEEWERFIPDRDELEDINTSDHAQGLLKSGHLEVEDVDASHDPSVSFDSLPVVRISEKGIQTIREWETMKKQAQWEQQLLETQEQYEESRLRRQQQFEKEQVTRSNEVNAAVGYLTIGLLIVTLSDVVLSVDQSLVPIWVIIGITLSVVLGLIYRIRKSGLLNPE
ncbi:hypothetical protein A6E15_13925 [Natrinema saccharevitans]|uniref:Uncharacterized protein n=1 Tax=Natrinema saccharevitans TaxID=301967 RepID=A0A1S8AZQ4_9EURY|nr:hypothetical protein [Natrinema saccharevitans]OLZ42009.1 hypothetical protein A6E15_13925 [Natrinema saccharevitans]